MGIVWIEHLGLLNQLQFMTAQGRNSWELSGSFALHEDLANCLPEKLPLLRAIETVEQGKVNPEERKI